MIRRTADEKFLIQLYKSAEAAGSWSAPVDYRRILTLLGQKETMGKTIMKSLAQANFIKKLDETNIILTEQGHRFVLSELDD